MFSVDRFVKCRTTSGSANFGQRRRRVGDAARRAAATRRRRCGTSHAGSRVARRPGWESSNSSCVERVLRIQLNFELVTGGMQSAAVCKRLLCAADCVPFTQTADQAVDLALRSRFSVTVTRKQSASSGIPAAQRHAGEVAGVERLGDESRHVASPCRGRRTP